MAEQQPDRATIRLSESVQDSVIVDTDVHISYQHDVVQEALAERMNEPYASYLRPGKNGESNAPYPSTGWAESVGGQRTDVMLDDVVSGRDIVENLCDTTPIDYAVINPLTPIDALRETDRAIEEMRAINDVLVERFLDGHEQLYGAIPVAAREPDKAAEEIDRMGSEDQVVAVLIPGPGAPYQKPMGDPDYDIIYKAAEDNDLAVVYHGTESLIQLRSMPILQDMERFVGAHAVGFPTSLMLTLTSLLIHGVPEKFPELNFIMVEAGVGWVPYMMGRLNREVAWRKSEAPMLEKSPEKYIRDQFYFGTQPQEEFDDPKTKQQVYEAAGAESMVFATDYPHWDFDSPGTTNTVLESFSEEDRAKILHGNASQAYPKLPI